jgi:hypothetical protein
MEATMRYPAKLWMIATAILFLSFTPLALPQSANSSAIVPLGQLAGDNLHPDFTNGDDYSFSKDHGPWLVWDAGNTVQRNIIARYYDPQQKRWLDHHSITSGIFINQHPDIEDFGDSVLVVWESNETGNFDIMFSLFDGNVWSEPAFVTFDLANDHKPALYTSRYNPKFYANALVCWERSGWIFWSRFNGNSWSSPAPIPGQMDSTQSPFIRGDFEFPFMVYEGLQENNWDIYGTWFLPDSNRGLILDD